MIYIITYTHTTRCRGLVNGDEGVLTARPVPGRLSLRSFPCTSGSPSSREWEPMGGAERKRRPSKCWEEERSSAIRCRANSRGGGRDTQREENLDLSNLTKFFKGIFFGGRRGERGGDFCFFPDRLFCLRVRPTCDPSTLLTFSCDPTLKKRFRF